MTNTTLPIVRVYLQLNKSSPDPIGFGNVSGFYGPGAWSAWLLTSCASWYNLIYRQTGFDANSWVYVIVLNGAAVDHLRHIHTMSALRVASDASWKTEAASVGSSLIVTWWGLFGLLSQRMS